MKYWNHSLIASVFACMAVVMSMGCQEQGPTPTERRQNAALRDPFHYSPYSEPQDDISGGELDDFDSKAMKKDVDNVLNP